MDRFLGHLRLVLLALLVGIVCGVGLVARAGFDELFWVGGIVGFVATIALPIWIRRRWQRAKAWRAERGKRPAEKAEPEATAEAAPRTLDAAGALEFIAGCGVRLRTPAERCPAEFAALFRERFEARFPAGCRNDRELLPDLVTLAEDSADDLARFSRAIGKDGGTPDLVALSRLPAQLVPGRPELRELSALVAGSPKALAARALLALWPIEEGVQPERAECVLYAQLLAKLGVGVEPDARFGGPRWKIGMQLQLFQLPPAALQAPSKDYSAAVQVVQLAAAVSAADGEISAPEREALREALAANLGLTPEERERLEVHVTWRLANPPKTLGLERRARSMTPDEREGIAVFLVRVACADGRIDPGEVRILERAYRLLELDPARVHTDLHTNAVGGESGDGPEIDHERVAAMRAETARVSTLLASIFVEDEELETAADEPESTIPGLDAAHAGLLLALAERPEWPRDDLEELAARFELLPDGALDTLNEHAFDEIGDPLWEGDDPVEIDMDVARQLAPPSAD